MAHVKAKVFFYNFSPPPPYWILATFKMISLQHNNPLPLNILLNANVCIFE